MLSSFDSLEHTQATLNKSIKRVLGALYLLTNSRRVKSVQNKEKIKILFVISELSLWKTENLYLFMLNHPRFEPILGLVVSPENTYFTEPLKNYICKKNYKWSFVEGKDISNINPDIIFYQKPYYSAYYDDIRHDRHWNALFCYVGYAFNSMDVDWAVNTGLYNFAWHIYYENELAAQTRRPLMRNKGKNLMITGLPFQDILMKSKSEYDDPWKKCGNRKRIIYAPHHTIGGIHFEGIDFSTFLNNAEFILQLAHKYQDQVQWAFKPHPLLKKNLISIWGEERTEAYYKEWASLPYSQLEEGKYESLFKYSDAMIHDCGSFTIEYLYTHNPVLYLIKDDHHADNLNSFATKAFNLHYKAINKTEIEDFILNVIDNKDIMKAEREKFYEDYLIPPHGKTACQNIVNAILGIEEYKV